MIWESTIDTITELQCEKCGDTYTEFADDPSISKCWNCVFMALVPHTRFKDGCSSNIPICDIPDCNGVANHFLPTNLSGGMTYDASPYYYCQEHYEAWPETTKRLFGKPIDPFEWLADAL